MTKLGVDVSKHNGNVDWQAVKNAGYGNFAIIRAGYGGDYSNQDDPQFERNVNECERLGIPYGVYLYSYSYYYRDGVLGVQVEGVPEQVKGEIELFEVVANRCFL